jgi:hypothetical protein
MQRGSRKHRHNWAAFAAWIDDSLRCLGWRDAELVRRTGINKGTLSAILRATGRGGTHYQRETLVAALSAALRAAGHQVDLARVSTLAGLSPERLPLPVGVTTPRPAAATPPALIGLGAPG